MKKWNRVLLIASAITAMGVFTACSSNKTETTAAETTAAQESTVDTTAKQPETIDERELVTTGKEYGNPVVDIKKMLEDFDGLLGEGDGSVTALLGDGIIEVAEGQPLSNRQYEMEVFGVTTITDVMYEADKAVMIQLVPEGIDMDFCKEEITKALEAEGTEATISNDGSKIDTVTWKLSKGQLTLRNAFDTVSLEITLAQ